jgi:hypothetical protein
MNYALSMGEAHGGKDLRKQPSDFVRRKRALQSYHVGKRPDAPSLSVHARNQFHNKKHAVFGVFDVVERDDIRVWVQPGLHGGLGLGPLSNGLVG